MMKILEYKFKDGSRLPQTKAETVGKRLKQLAGRTATLEPEAVVADARDKSSPLHEFFEWDDTKAAEQHRLEQARLLIRSVVVVYESVNKQEPPRECRAYYTTEASSKGGPYIATARILDDADMRAALIAEALREADQWRRRYEHLTELCDIVTAIMKFTAPKKRSQPTPGKRGGLRQAGPEG